MTIRPTGVEPTEETTPPPTFRADLARFTSGGFGTLRDDPATRSLRPGDLIAVTGRSSEKLLDDARAACGEGHDEPTLRLPAGLAELGWNKALDAGLLG